MSKILVNEMSFYYEPYYNPVFERVNLILDTDWRLGLTGRNGRGKTTFFKAPGRGAGTDTGKAYKKRFHGVLSLSFRNSL